MNPPTVSVVVIFYNDERFLAEAVDSVLAQHFTDLEVILADDGSRDASTAIAHRYAASDPDRIRYVHHPGHANEGISATRNLGIASASARYVAFLDSDDVWEPDKLTEQVALLDANPEVGLVVGASLYWYSWARDGSGPDRVRLIGAPQNTVISPPDMATMVYPFGKGVAPCPSSFLMRRDVLEHLGGFERQFRGLYEDQAMLAKAYLTTAVYVSSRCWDRYRRHSGAIMLTSSDAEYHRARQHFLEWYEQYLDEQDHVPPAVGAALRRAWWPYRHPRAAAVRRRLGVSRAAARSLSRRGSKLARRMIDWARQQQEMRRLLRAQRRSLTRGRYRIVGELAYRAGYALSPQLRESKATSRFSLPALVLRGARHPAGYPCIASGNGGVLLFGGASGTVKRVSPEPIFNEEFVRIRERFSRHLPAPSFAVDPTGRMQIEQQVNGVYPDELGETERLEVVKVLLRRLVSLCRDEQQGDSRVYLKQAMGELDPFLLPPPLRLWLPALRSSNLLADAPLVPSHGDFLPKNLLVEAHVTWAIDWDPRYVGLRPFWYDPMTLMGASDHLRRAFVDGRFDTEFVDLLDVAGLPSAFDRTRHLLAAAHLVTIPPFPPRHGMGSRVHHQQINEHFNKWVAAVGTSEFPRL